MLTLSCTILDWASLQLVSFVHLILNEPSQPILQYCCCEFRPLQFVFQVHSCILQVVFFKSMILDEYELIFKTIEHSFDDRGDRHSALLLDFWLLQLVYVAKKVLVDMLLHLLLLLYHFLLHLLLKLHYLYIFLRYGMWPFLRVRL